MPAKIQRLLFLLLPLALLLPSCSTTYTVYHEFLPAAPAAQLKGSLQIGQVRNLPADSGEWDPKQIPNSAPLGSLALPTPVDQYFRQALQTQLSMAGLDTGSGTRHLEADIVRLFADDLGWDVDWYLTVRYRVVEETGDVAYEEAKETRLENTHKMATLTDHLSAMDLTIKRNIDALLTDPAFVASIQD